MSPYRRFLFRLGLQIGEWDVDALEAAMPLSVLYEWMAFDRLEPFGYEAEYQRWRVSEYRAFLRNGMLISSIVNLFSGRRARKYKAADFIPEHVTVRPAVPKEPKPPAHIYQLLKTALGLMGAKKTNADD